jgi:hypothetical protein
MRPAVLIFILLIQVFASCRPESQDRNIERYLVKEIRNRIEVLDRLSSENDSVKVYARAIDEEISSYILLSKDHENLSAAVNKANAYFLNMANSYQLNDDDFTKLNTGMSLSEISSVLRQNELNLFNQLVFKYQSSPSMYTAH